MEVAGLTPGTPWPVPTGVPRTLRGGRGGKEYHNWKLIQEFRGSFTEEWRHRVLKGRWEGSPSGESSSTGVKGSRPRSSTSLLPLGRSARIEVLCPSGSVGVRRGGPSSYGRDTPGTSQQILTGTCRGTASHGSSREFQEGRGSLTCRVPVVSRHSRRRTVPCPLGPSATRHHGRRPVRRVPLSLGRRDVLTPGGRNSYVVKSLVLC